MEACSEASASAAFSWWSASRPALMKRTSQGRSLGRYDQRMLSGPSSFSSQPGTFASIPGAGVGTSEAGASTPALPNDDAPSSPGRCRSIRVTRAPCSWRYVAQHAPTTPAPMTTT